MVKDRIERYESKVVIKYRPTESSLKWESITWREFGEQINALSLALLKFGIRQEENVGIISRNMPKWTITDIAIMNIRGVNVPIHSVETVKHIEYVLNETESRLLFVGEQEQYDKAVKIIQRSKFLEIIVVFDKAVKLEGNVNSVYYNDFVKSDDSDTFDNELKLREEQCSREDLATIIYTSGTTGEPKGVMLSHANFVDSIYAHDLYLPKMNEDDRSLTFLPLSHIFERAWTYVVLHKGMTNFYLRDPRKVVEVLKTAKPTVMCAVPRFFEKSYITIKQQLEEKPAIAQKIFFWALKVGGKHLELRRTEQKIPAFLKLKYSIACLLVFNKGRKVLGNCIKFMPCAGASLADEINRFFHIAGINIKYGYGLTETCATVTAFRDTGFKFGTVDKPLPGIEVKIGENNEILIKSRGVTKGYYKNKQATDESFVNGWYRTGDAGSIDEDGYLIMTERIKEIFKTSTGKYVSPQKVELCLVVDSLVSQVVAVGDDRKYISALIVPEFQKLKEYAQSKKLKYSSEKELISLPEIKDLFYKKLEELQNDLADFEKIKRITLLASEFTIENGLITPTLKVKRKAINAAFSDHIEQMYEE